MASTTTFAVGMTCDGCAGAVVRAALLRASTVVTADAPVLSGHRRHRRHWALLDRANCIVPSLRRPQNRILRKIAGVQDVAADVGAKTVLVTHSAEAQPEAMLAALKKWGDAAGKTVELKA